MDPLTNRGKVRIHFYGLTFEINNFAFEVKVIFGPESTLLGGWVGGNFETITNSASAGAEVEARLSLAIMIVCCIVGKSPSFTNKSPTCEKGGHLHLHDVHPPLYDIHSPLT